MARRLRDSGSALSRWALRWAVLFSLWLAISDNVKLAELLTGAVAAAIASAAGQIVLPAPAQRSRPRAEWLWPALKMVWYWPRETLQVLVQIGRRALRRGASRGRFRAVRFEATTGGPRGRARRVSVEWLGSLAPNRYVIGIDDEQGYLLYHELVDDERPADPLPGR